MANTISESTPIKLGLIITIVVLLTGGLGGFATCVWWASSISTKLDTVISNQTTVNGNIQELQAKDISIDREIADLKIKNALLESKLDNVFKSKSQ